MVELATSKLDILSKSELQTTVTTILHQKPEDMDETPEACAERSTCYNQRCEFCGQREPYLASHFVRVQTWEEWEADLTFKLMPSSSTPPIALDDVKLLVTSLEGNVASTVSLLETFLDNARNRVQWRIADAKLNQADEDDMQNDPVATAHFKKYPPVTGSCIVHEVCMEYMHEYRKLSLPRTLLRDETKIMELLANVGRGKTKPIGVDQLGGRYFVFSGCAHLFVSSPPAHLTDTIRAEISTNSNKNVKRNMMRLSSSNMQLGNAGESSAQSQENDNGNSDFQRQYLSYAGFDPVDEVGGLTWVVYRSETEIGQVMRWLDCDREDERHVYKTLSFLFPAADKLEDAKESSSAGDASTFPVAHAQDFAVDNKLADMFVADFPQELEGHESESDINSDSDLSACVDSHVDSDEEAQVMDTESEAEVEVEDDEAEVHVSMFEGRGRKSKSKANRALAAQAKEELKDRRKRANNKTNADGEDESEFNAPLNSALYNPPMEDNTMVVDGAVVEGELGELGEEAKPVRILHPDDEPKKRGRPQQPLKANNKLPSAALNKGETMQIGIVVPPQSVLKVQSDYLVQGVGRKAKPNAPKVFGIKNRVIVQNSNNGILWDATVLDKKELDEERTMYRVRFDRWGSAYDTWVPANCIAALTDVACLGRHRRNARQMLERSRHQYAQNQHWNFPEPICNLRAAAVLEDAALQGVERAQINFSDATPDNSLGMLRAAMLVVEAALPEQCKDENEEKWGRTNFSMCWREGVAQAKDATDMMCALLVLENAIKSSWMKPTGMKLMACMPSRHIMCRRATVGLVAMRLQALDATIRYEKDMEVRDTGKDEASSMLRKQRP